MNKRAMIEWISRNYASWEAIYYGAFKSNSNKLNGWFICYDGYRVEDMFLQSEDPRGDVTGHVIYKSDVVFTRR